MSIRRYYYDFSSEEEFNSELEKVTSMSVNEQIAYAKNKGFTSFGAECRKFYKSIDFEGFKSKNELEKFVIMNSDYIEIIEDEQGEFSIEQKLSDRNDRFFLNKNHVYQIGNVIYKALDEGTAVTSEDNIEIIYEMGNNVDFFKHDERFVFESNFKKSSGPILKSMQGCGTYKSGNDTNGRERLLAEIGVDNKFRTKVICYFKAKAQKKSWLGYWYNIDRHFSCRVNINYKYYDDHYGNGWQTGRLVCNINNNIQETIDKTVEVSGENIVGSGAYEPGFTSYSVWVDTDAVNGINLSCY